MPKSNFKAGPIVVIVLILMTVYYVIIFKEARKQHVATSSDQSGQ